MAITYQGDYKAVVKEGPENEPIVIFEVSDGEPIPSLKGEVQGITSIEIDQPCTGPDFFQLELNVHELVDNSDIGHRV